MKKLLTINEAAQEFGIGRNKLYRMIKTEPDIPILKLEGIYKVNSTMFSEWLDKATREGREL